MGSLSCAALVWGARGDPQEWETVGFSLTSAPPLFQAAGLHFRHTDNINHWRDAMSHVGLPSVTSPLCCPQPRDTLAFALCQYWGGVLVWQGGLCSPFFDTSQPGDCLNAKRCLLSCWQIFHPETTDIYDKKNMPRVVYCIHALRWVPWPGHGMCGRAHEPFSGVICQPRVTQKHREGEAADVMAWVCISASTSSS